MRFYFFVYYVAMRLIPAIFERWYKNICICVLLIQVLFILISQDKKKCKREIVEVLYLAKCTFECVPNPTIQAISIVTCKHCGSSDCRNVGAKWKKLNHYNEPSNNGETGTWIKYSGELVLACVKREKKEHKKKPRFYRLLINCNIWMQQHTTIAASKVLNIKFTKMNPTSLFASFTAFNYIILVFFQIWIQLP